MRVLEIIRIQNCCDVTVLGPTDEVIHCGFQNGLSTELSQRVYMTHKKTELLG